MDSFSFAEVAMRFQRAFSAIMTLSVLVLARPATAASINDFISYSLLDNNNNSLLRGLLHVPTEYAADPTTPRPLILFLHGSGESGTNNLSQINGNIDNLLAAAKARGAFLYAPQTNIGWENTTLFSYAMTMIDRTIAERDVDLNRIYVTGLSMGGGGVWNFLNQFPDRVAASVPICAVDPSSNFLPAKVVNEPIWAFHGRSDANVPVTVTRNVINSLLSQAGQPIPTYPAISNTFGPDVQFDFPPLNLHYTDKRGDHGIWPSVYSTPAMYDWMFAQGSVPEPSTLVLGLFSVIAAGCRRRKFT
jgi:predicted peptidase